MMGVDLRTVQELMGHKEIKMTCRYAHMAPDHQIAALHRLDRWGNAGPGSDTKTDTGARRPAQPAAKSSEEVPYYQ